MSARSPAKTNAPERSERSVEFRLDLALTTRAARDVLGIVTGGKNGTGNGDPGSGEGRGTGGVRIDKLEPNLTYRIALRTTSSAESKAVIGTPEAQYITNKESGVGFLRVGMEDPVKFHSTYLGVNYVPTAPVQDNGESKPRVQRPDRIRIHQFTAAPIFDAAVTR